MYYYLRGNLTNDTRCGRECATEKKTSTSSSDKSVETTISLDIYYTSNYPYHAHSGSKERNTIPWHRGVRSEKLQAQANWIAIDPKQNTTRIAAGTVRPWYPPEMTSMTMSNSKCPTLPGKGHCLLRRWWLLWLWPRILQPWPNHPRRKSSTTISRRRVTWKQCQRAWCIAFAALAWYWLIRVWQVGKGLIRYDLSTEMALLACPWSVNDANMLTKISPLRQLQSPHTRESEHIAGSIPSRCRSGLCGRL